MTGARGTAEPVDEGRRSGHAAGDLGRVTDEMLWEWDVATGTVTRAVGDSVYGYGRAEIVPTREWWSERVHPDDRARVDASLDAALAGAEERWGAQYRFARKDGTYATVADRCHIIRRGGTAVRLVGIVQDVGELERARELARRAAAGAELLARASHELRTPLNAILGFSDLLEQRLALSMGTREQRYLKNIRDAGQHLLSLVDRLLQIAKADSGRLELRRAVVTLAALVEPLASEHAERAAASGIAWEVEPLPAATVRLDPDRIGTVIRELLANALRVTPRGGRVTVRALRTMDDLVLEVSDSGPGIPEEARDRIFGVFERLRDDVGPGTGLGLALCRELVELHGGTIVFETEDGLGTTFRVRLPHCVLSADAVDRVLIVEDEPNDADLAATVARDAGIACEVVGSVADARLAIARGLPRAVVLDLRLPDGSGSEVIAALRALGPLVPVAVVTAYEDEPQPDGAAVRIAKPIDTAVLDAWLRASAAGVVA